MNDISVGLGILAAAAAPKISALDHQEESPQIHPRPSSSHGLSSAATISGIENSIRSRSLDLTGVDFVSSGRTDIVSPVFRDGFLPPVSDSFDRFATNHADPYFASQVPHPRPSSAPRPAGTSDSSSHDPNAKPSDQLSATPNWLSVPPHIEHNPMSSLALRIYSTSLEPLTADSVHRIMTMTEELRSMLKPAGRSRLIRPSTSLAALGGHPGPTPESSLSFPRSPTSKKQSSTSNSASSESSSSSSSASSACHWCRKPLGDNFILGPLNFPLCQSCGQIYGSVRTTSISLTRLRKPLPVRRPLSGRKKPDQ